MASLHQLDLPWLGERKSREAIPFALEEQLAQPVSSLHMAFSKVFYQQGRYLVVVLDKAMCLQWVHRLEAAGVVFESMVLDWFALNPEEVLITSTGILVNQQQFQGALGEYLAADYLKKYPLSEGYYCSNSSTILRYPSMRASTVTVQEWIAKRLLQTPTINLCQGDVKPIVSATLDLIWLRRLGVLFGMWVLTAFCMKAMRLFELNTSLAQTNTQIERVYHAYFPAENSVSNPKFRIEQLLKSNASTQQRLVWFLIQALSSAVNQHADISLEQVNFQAPKLSVKLVAPNFAALEAFENQLKKGAVSVNQLSAASADNRVSAVLELNE
jgi:general secretion pathway protein L